MKYIISITIIILVLLLCLFYEKKTNEKFESPGMPVINKVTQIDMKKLVIEWTKPSVPNPDDPINRYLILIKKNNARNAGIFMNFSTDGDCEKCKYTIENIDLEPSTKYMASIIAINLSGGSEPSNKFIFKTFDTVDDTEAPNNTTSTQQPSELVRLGESGAPSYQDMDLANMVSRANGIYELNTTQMAYPQTFVKDVKDSIDSLNEQVKTDLQEYRLNIHLSGTGLS